MHCLRLPDYYLCSLKVHNDYLHQIGSPPTSQWRSRSLIVFISPPKETCPFHCGFPVVSAILPFTCSSSTCSPSSASVSLYWPPTLCPHCTLTSHPQTAYHSLAHCPISLHLFISHSFLNPGFHKGGPWTTYILFNWLLAKSADSCTSWIRPPGILEPAFMHTYTLKSTLIFFLTELYALVETCHSYQPSKELSEKDSDWFSKLLEIVQNICCAFLYSPTPSMAGLATWLALANETWAETPAPFTQTLWELLHSSAYSSHSRNWGYPRGAAASAWAEPGAELCTQPTTETKCRWEVACGLIVMWRALYAAARCCSPYFTICFSNYLALLPSTYSTSCQTGWLAFPHSQVFQTLCSCLLSVSCLPTTPLKIWP